MNEKLRELLSDILKVDACEIEMSWRLGLAPNWDSFAHVEIILMLGEDFGIEINESNIHLIQSVAEINELVGC